MSYAMFCATHGPQYKAPCPECGAWHTDPRPETPAEHDKLRNAIDAVRDTEPDYEHARLQMERLGIAARLADEARDRREANELREYLRLPLDVRPTRRASST